ncbi:MAG: hypothetical protein AB7N80_11135 [Bdellovibrionales bacterium]
MKTVISLLVMLSAAVAFAGEGSASLKGVKALSFATLANAKITEQCKGQENCRSRGMYKVELTFAMRGCVDRLGPVAVKYDDYSNTLYVAAVNLHTERSERVRCVVQATEQYSLIVPGLNDDTTVEALSKPF